MGQLRLQKELKHQNTLYEDLYGCGWLRLWLAAPTAPTNLKEYKVGEQKIELPWGCGLIESWDRKSSLQNLIWRRGTGEGALEKLMEIFNNHLPHIRIFEWLTYQKSLVSWVFVYFFLFAFSWQIYSCIGETNYILLGIFCTEKMWAGFKISVIPYRVTDLNDWLRYYIHIGLYMSHRADNWLIVACEFFYSILVGSIRWMYARKLVCVLFPLKFSWFREVMFLFFFFWADRFQIRVLVRLAKDSLFHNGFPVSVRTDFLFITLWSPISLFDLLSSVWQL